jgi:predicted RNA binding protein YcfA (HicA-like mRNA interferase family)
MSRKIRDLIKELNMAGWIQVPGGKGSHRKFKHDKFPGAVVIPGHDNDDAKPYLEKQVRNAVKGKIHVRVARIIEKLKKEKP